MGRTFVKATPSYLSRSSAPVTAVPITMAVWARLTEATTLHQLLRVDDGTGNNLYRLGADGTLASNGIIAQQAAAGAFAAATTATGYSANTWFHAAAVFTSSTSRAAFFNGANKATNATAGTPSGINATLIGGPYGPESADGIVCECAIWNVALTDAEILALARGVNPRNMRPQKLVFYVPVWGTGSPEPDYTAGQRHMTLVSSPAAASLHARVAPMAAGDFSMVDLRAPGVVSLGGELTPAGSLRRDSAHLLGGELTPAGAQVRAAAKALGGSLTSAGAISSRAMAKALPGVLTPAGALSKAIAKPLGATFGSNPNSLANEGFEVDLSNWFTLGSGVTLTRDTADFHAGVASMRINVVGGTQYSTGAISLYAAAAPGESWRCTFWAKGAVGETFRSYVTESDSAGAYLGVAWGSTPGNTFTGAWQQFTHTIPRVSNPSTARLYFSIRLGNASGSQIFWIDDVVFTKMTLQGTLAKAIAKPRAGTLTPSGVLSMLLTPFAGDWLLAVGGTLAPTGALARSTAKSLAGTLTSAGSFAATTAGLWTVALSGALTSSGTLAKAVAKPLAGVFATSGKVTKDYAKTVTRGTLTTSGKVTRTMAKPLAGALQPAGTVVKAVSHRLAGVLTFAGVVVSYFPTAWAVSLAGSLRFKGRVAFPPRPEQDDSFLDDRGVPWPERRRLGLRRRK